MVSARRSGLPLVVAGLIVLAGLSLGRVYNGQLLVQLVGGAALGSVLISVLSRRAPAWLVAPVSVLAMVGYCAYAISTSARAGAVPGELRALAVDAAGNALPRLLTALIPVEPQPDTVLGPVVLAWLAGFAGAELAARGRRPAAALIPPTLLYVGALVLVGPNAPVNPWQPLAYAALAALGLVVGGASSGAGRLRGIGARERTALRVRTATGLATGLVAVLAVALAIAPLVANTVGTSPADPRRYVQPPALGVIDQNPLIRLSGWAANPAQHLFDVDVIRGAKQPTPSASPTPTPTQSGNAFNGDVPPPPAAAESSEGFYDTRLRLAILPDWDGVTWHMDAQYRNAGRVLPPPTPPPGDSGAPPAQPPPPLTVEERITVDDLEGRLLPAISAPQRIEGLRVAYDQSNGTLLNTAPLTPGVTYTVTSVSRSVDLTFLQAADVPDGDAVARFLAVGPKVPPDLSHLAEQVVQGESSPYLRALAMESFLAEHYTYASDAPSGHAYPNLAFFLLGDPRAGGRRGTSEQFATAFAALGRLLGLPTRVVVGFRTPAGGGAITGKDALAWPEVLFKGVGWVAFDPLPAPNTAPQPLQDDLLPKPPPPTTPPPSVTPPPAVTVTAAPPGSGPPAFAARGPGVATVATGVAGGLVGLLAVLAIAILLSRAVLSRSRLRAADPPRQVLGAWHEVLDSLTLAGSPPPPHLAAAEVASHAARVAAASTRRLARRPRPAAPPLYELAANVNAVAFAGDSAAGPDELAGFGARALAVEYRRALYTRRSWWRRLLWRLDPRPLLRKRP